MNYIELFSGAGGMALGFEKAGFKNVFSVEYDKKIALTYRKNFPSNILIEKDIKDISDKEIIQLVDNKNIDLVVGGPPCQGFSLAGKIGRNFLSDDRNYLFLEFVRFVKIVRPKIFVMENVARMLSHNKGNTIVEIENKFKEIGYKVKYKVLQANDYGIAQKRQRIFVVGTSDNNTFEFPPKIKSNLTIKDVIDDLPKLRSGEKSSIPNHTAMNHSSQMLEKMSYIQDGGNRTQIPEKLRPKSGDIRKYIKYKSSEPSVTITGDMRKIFHYSQNRALTPRELARIQSFPDSFIFVGNSLNIQQQIGNAVPAKLAYEVAMAVKAYLKGKSNVK